MAIVFDAPVTPDALTVFIREVPWPSHLTLSNLFPTRTFETNTVNFSEVVRTNRTARFRAFDGRIHVSERDAGSDGLVRLPPLSSSLGMGEYERLLLEFARTGGTNTAALERAIYNDAENLTREVQNRIDQAWGDLLSDGILSINENGYSGEADFDVPPEHIVDAAISWDDTANAKVLTDLTAWHDAFVISNGGTRAGEIRTSQLVQRLMLRNQEVINAVHGAAAGRTSVTLRELNDHLLSEGLPTVATTTLDDLVDVDGVSTRVFDQHKLLFTPTNIGDLGYLALGVSATALELVDSPAVDFSFEEAPGIVGVVEKVGPPYRQFTFVDAVGMPILQNSKLLFIATVITDEES